MIVSKDKNTWKSFIRNGLANTAWKIDAQKNMMIMMMMIMMSISTGASKHF